MTVRILALVAASSFAVLSQAQTQSPKVLLRKALEGQRRVSFVRIESRPGGDGGTEWKLKVQTSEAKGIKVTILSPLSQSGVVSVDDSKILKTYFPDQGIVLVQPSPVLLQPSVEWRMKLIETNYQIVDKGWDSVAGQKVREIVLEPTHEQVPRRRLFIDDKHRVVLRYVVEAEYEKASVLFDTKSATFDAAAASKDFDLPADASDAHVRNRPGPSRISGSSESKVKAGFSARMPDRLPYGFKVSGTFLFDDTRTSYVLVRVSDGMASLSLYQWLDSFASRAPTSAQRVTDAFGVNYAIALPPGERLSEDVLDEIIEAFVHKSDWDLELSSAEVKFMPICPRKAAGSNFQ